MRHIIRGGRSLAPALLLVTLALAGCSEERGSFMDAGGPIAADQFTHMVRATMLIMIVVLPVLILGTADCLALSLQEQKRGLCPELASFHQT